VAAGKEGVCLCTVQHDMFATICRSPTHLARISSWLPSLGVVLLLVVDRAGM
jgi:hypothetical protein